MSLVDNSRRACYEMYKTSNPQKAKEFLGDRYEYAKNVVRGGKGIFLLGGTCALIALIIAAVSQPMFASFACSQTAFIVSVATFGATVLTAGLVTGIGYLMKRSILAEQLPLEEIQRINLKFADKV